MQSIPCKKSLDVDKDSEKNSLFLKRKNNEKKRRSSKRTLNSISPILYNIGESPKYVSDFHSKPNLCNISSELDLSGVYNKIKSFDEHKITVPKLNIQKRRTPARARGNIINNLI